MSAVKEMSGIYTETFMESKFLISSRKMSQKQVDQNNFILFSSSSLLLCEASFKYNISPLTIVMIEMFVTRKSPLDVNKAHSGDDEKDGEHPDDGDEPSLGEHGLDTGHGELRVPGALVVMAGGRGHHQAHPLTERSHASSITMTIKYHRYGREVWSRVPSWAY